MGLGKDIEDRLLDWAEEGSTFQVHTTANDRQIMIRGYVGGSGEMQLFLVYGKLTFLQAASGGQFVSHQGNWTWWDQVKFYMGWQTAEMAIPDMFESVIKGFSYRALRNQ